MTATDKARKILPLLRRAAGHARKLHLLKEQISLTLDAPDGDLHPLLAEVLRAAEVNSPITLQDAVEFVKEVGDYEYCDTCGEDLNSQEAQDGYNGECGNCADKTEAKRLKENPDD